MTAIDLDKTLGTVQIIEFTLLISRIPSNINMIAIFGSKSNFAPFFCRREFSGFPVGFANFMIRGVHTVFSKRGD